MLWSDLYHAILKGKKAKCKTASITLCHLHRKERRKKMYVPKNYSHRKTKPGIKETSDLWGRKRKKEKE